MKLDTSNVNVVRYHHECQTPHNHRFPLYVQTRYVLGIIIVLSCWYNNHHPTIVQSFSILPYHTTTTTQSSSFLNNRIPTIHHQHKIQQQPTTAILPVQEFTTMHQKHTTITKLFSSFAADGSEYSQDNNDYDDDNNNDEKGLRGQRGGGGGSNENNGKLPATIELRPVPISKNGGQNRFVVMVWDHEIYEQQQKQLQQQEEKDALDLHYDRIDLTEEHVMYCRKTNLYNDTFNTESMVDVMWSLPILSTDLHRVIGHTMCLESPDIQYVQDFLRYEPIIKMLTSSKDNDDDNKNEKNDNVGDLTNIPLYRWRHIRDYSLRIDDGRFGYPCMCVALDYQPVDNEEESLESMTLRNELEREQIEYLIRSERVIATGPLHIPTPNKDDPNSKAVGDFILFNAPNRTDAIQFVEQLPYSKSGLYDNVRVHFYNQLDITGKFVSEDPLRDSPCEQLKEAMEVWGYPVHDDQTAWLNC